MAELQDHTLSDAGAEHQSLLDRAKSVFQGALSWVESHLPEHEDKAGLLNSIKDQWETAAGIIKADFEAVKTKAVSDAESAAKDVAATAVPAAENAVQAVETAAEGTVQDVSQSVSQSPSTPAAPAEGQ